MEWNFPKQAGQIRGYADAGIEFFTGNAIASLAREICQNSLDALENGKICKIEFSKSVIPTNKIPGYDSLLRNYKNAYNYWQYKGDKPKEYLEKVISCLKGSQINILRISDFNTAGVAEPFAKKPDSDWISLTRLDGGSTKSGDKNGGFGIGKNAPFANSIIRTVFYRTYNKQNEKAAQGLIRTMSFPTDNKSEEMAFSTMTSGFGYYGCSDNMPIGTIPELDDLCKREEHGTDVFIYGFNTNNTSEWKTNIIVEVLNNFLVAIYEEVLEVVVDSTIINKANLANLINMYILNSNKATEKTTYSNYMVLTNSNTKTYDLSFHGMGNLKLKVLIEPNLDLDKKILRTRENGMKLFASSKVSSSIMCSGILILEGDKLKKYFKQLEPPAHDKWEANRANNIQEAKVYIEEIKNWERKIVEKLGRDSNLKEINIQGLSSNLAAYDGENNTSISESGREILDFIVEKTEIQEINNKSKNRAKLLTNGTTNNNKQPTKEQGVLDDTAQNPVHLRHRRNHKIKSHNGHKGSLNPNGGELVSVLENKGDAIELDSFRLIKVSKHSYKVVFILPKSVKKGHIEINVIGDNSKGRKINIVSLYGTNNIDNLELNNNKITFDSILDNIKASFLFDLDDELNYAMEMKIYEH